jgi:asparagine synthase (glutamine-hydrolysing)
MCGIAGFITSSGFSKDELENRVMLMNKTMMYRGPDDEGAWVDEKAGLALAQGRLSIQDLSEAGHQPMHSSNDRWVIVYNGETYSNKEITPQLEAKGIKFRGHSDTEVMLEAFDAWGVEKATEQFIGMFAFALWDKKEQILYLVRDRLGIKPLYWFCDKGTLAFASELKALRAYPDFSFGMDQQALAAYLRYGYVPAPYSIHKDVHKLLPGTILSFKLGEQPKVHTYWSLKNVIQQAKRETSEGSIEELHELLKDAVGRRMIADVPYGAFLSGGIDSSLVVALMQAQSTKPVKTFTIGFTEHDFNEAPFAKAIAQHLGTEHTELYITPTEAQNVIPKLPSMYDEPFADVSQIPTFLVSQLARQHVTVALSGDGGDELFAGYNRYVLGEKLWKQCQRLPARNALGHVLSHVPHGVWKALEALLPKRYKNLRPADRVARLTHMLKSKTPQELYSCLISQWLDPNALLRADLEPELTSFQESMFLPNFVEKMQYIDAMTYLPDDILVKVDRASMAVSLEARVPLLDHRVVAWAWQQPITSKIQGHQGKLQLREVLKKYVPTELFERPKMGFGVPIDSWLRGDLRDWAEDLLDVNSLSEIVDIKPIRQAWEDHLNGRSNHQYPLWTILMLQAWRKEWKF